MSLINQIYQTISESLKIDLGVIHEDLMYQSIKEWDSLAHVTLILDLEKKFNVSIAGADSVNLTRVKNIAQFILNQKGENHFSSIELEKHQTRTSDQIFRGLNQIHFDTTEIVKLDQENNQIYYRGYPLSELVVRCSYEQVAFLLLFGRIPLGLELQEWKKELAELRVLSAEQVSMIRLLKNKHPAEVLRTLLSAYGETSFLKQEELGRSYLDEAIRFMAIAPSVVAAHDRIRKNLDLVDPDHSLSFASHFLYSLTGKKPNPIQEKMFDQDLSIHAEHSSNASTFVARISVGAQADFCSSVTAALGAFSGRVHGGAIEEVLKMFSEIKSVSEVKDYIRLRMQKGLGVPGFGHRVYKVQDPRAPLLLNIVQELHRDLEKASGLENNSLPVNFDLVEAIKTSMTPYREKGMEINVDFYAGLSYRLLGIPDDLAVSIFFMSRLAGLSAHILEQSKNNILIRPLLKYTGSLRSLKEETFL